MNTTYLGHRTSRPWVAIVGVVLVAVMLILLAVGDSVTATLPATFTAAAYVDDGDRAEE